jgi:aconitase A
VVAEALSVSNLVGMGVLPLQKFKDGVPWQTLEMWQKWMCCPVAHTLKQAILVIRHKRWGLSAAMTTTLRIDTPIEIGLLPPRAAFCRTCCASY